MPASSPSGPSPVDSIRLVERFERPAANYTFKATSLPGHLLHLVVAGRVEQTCNGRRQQLAPGTVVWYHEDEWVEGRVLAAPWIYYSVNFAAPTLAPPEFDARLQAGRADLQPVFAALHAAWLLPPSRERDYRVQACLLDLLAALAPAASGPAAVMPDGRRWWEVEAWARQHIDRPISLPDICRQFNLSPNTLARACRAAVGLPPMRRLKQIRLSLARGLVHYSDLNMTEIALRVGYGRVHEFSRDYRKAHGRPPTVDRAGARDPR
ncbi:MAG: helix-turn-helix domain-containing protein [Opitutales bacterium]